MKTLKITTGLAVPFTTWLISALLVLTLSLAPASSRSRTFGEEAQSASEQQAGHAESPQSDGGKKGPEQDVTFWLLDDNGEWKVPLPNWSLDDISAFLDQKEEEKSISSYTILSLSAAGSVTGNVARIKIEYRINLNHTAAEDTIRVPLGMKEGIYRPEKDENGTDQNFSTDGPGKVVLDVDVPTGGYAVLITPSPRPEVSASSDEEVPETNDASRENEKTESAGSIYTVQLTLLFPVQQTANTDEQVIHITPPAAISSQLTVVVPFPDIESSTSEGALAAQPVVLDEKSSEIKITGFNRNGKTTDIRWRPSERNEAAIPVTYRVENAVIELAPSGDGIEYNVRLPIRFFGGSKENPVRLLKVELPEGTRPDMQSLHVVSRDNLDIADVSLREIFADENRPRPIIEVTVPADLEFILLRFAAFASISEDRKWECTGFHLEGAQKETGDLIVRLPSNENILPDLVPGTGVREAENNDRTAEENDTEKTVRFRFYKEPFSLKSDPIPRLTRTIAAPEFQILVSGDNLKLKARINYSVYGAPLRSLRANPAGWIIGHINQDGNIDADNICTDPKTGETVFPLKNPAVGDFSVEWEAVRNLNLERDRIEFELPNIVADWTAPASVVIVPDDDIELVPMQGRLTRLEQKNQTSLHSILEIPKRQSPPLIYQIQKSETEEGAMPLFSARFIKHTQTISAESETVVHLETVPPTAEQTLIYRVKYLPADKIVFALPPELADLTSLEIDLNGKRVPPESIIDEHTKGSSGEILKKRISLPGTGTIGDIRLTLRYPLEKLKVEPDRSNNIDILFATPEELTQGSGFETNRIEATAPSNTRVYLPPQEDASSLPWKESGSGERGEYRFYRFVTHSQADAIPLRAAIEESRLEGGTNLIERLWVQTWIYPDFSFESLYCRVTGNRPYLELKLPEGVQNGKIDIRINDSSIADTDFSYENQMLRIHLPETAKTETALVSIAYSVMQKEGTAPALTFPNFEIGSTTIRRCYRQIILPESLHLRKIPKGWMPEYDTLERKGILFRRAPALSTQDLADWIQTKQYERIPKNVNEYLLGSFSPPASAPLALISRAVLVLFGSSIVLILGILYIYIPKIRIAEGIAVPVIILLGTLILRPAVVLIYLQTAAAGLVLLLVVFILKRFIDTRTTAVPQPQNYPPTQPQRAQTIPAPERTHDQTSARETAESPVTASESSRSKLPSTEQTPDSPEHEGESKAL